MSRCSLITLNYNGSQDTIEMIDSVLCAEQNPVDLIIIDGNSPRKDELFLIEKFYENKYEATFEEEDYFDKKISSTKRLCVTNGSSIVLIQANGNYGFSIGSNIGIKYALERNETNQFIALLNNDTVVTKDFLTNIISKMTNNDIDAAMGTILYYEDHKYIWSIGGYINWLEGAGVHLHKNENFNYDLAIKNDFIRRDFISGCFTVFKKEAIMKIGLLDEAYFFGAEEYQYSIDLSKRKMKMAWIPNSIIYHKSKFVRGNGSSHDIIKSEWQYNSYINKILLINKNKKSVYRVFWRFLFLSYINILAKKRNNNAKSVSSKQWRYMKKCLRRNIKIMNFTINDFLEYKRGFINE